MPNNVDWAYKTHKRYLMHMAITMTRRSELAEEMVNGMFLDILEKNEVILKETARPWLIKRLIMYNGNKNNKSKRMISLKELRGFEYNHVALSPNVLTDPNSLEEQLTSSSERNMIADKIACLPFDQAMLVNAVIYTNVKDAARVLNLDHDVAKQRYISYTKTLRSWLKGYYNNVYGGTSEGVRSNRRANRVGA